MSSRNFLLGLCLAACCSMQAATLTYDFRSGSSTPSTSAGGVNYGNSYTFTVGGVSVVATGWGLTGGASNNTFQTGYVGRYSTGIGVCNQEESCVDPAHQVDNDGQLDFMLFQFSKPVDPLSIVIDPAGTYDRDVTYYTGNTTNPLNLSGVTLAGLSSLGLVGPTHDASTISGDPRTVSLTSPFVNTVLFGARIYGSGADSFEDRFKIASLTAETPEPATLGLSGLAILALGMVQRRRAAARQ